MFAISTLKNFQNIKGYNNEKENKAGIVSLQACFGGPVKWFKPKPQK